MIPQISAESGDVFVSLMAVPIGLLVLASIGVTILIYCRIFTKAGFPWALGLLQLVPVLNLVMRIYLAFADWPVQRELRQLKQHTGAGPA